MDNLYKDEEAVRLLNEQSRLTRQIRNYFDKTYWVNFIVLNYKNHLVDHIEHEEGVKFKVNNPNYINSLIVYDREIHTTLIKQDRGDADFGSYTPFYDVEGTATVIHDFFNELLN
jgi:hypothetical protein